MSNAQVVGELEAASLKKNIPDFAVGDTVRVHVRIVETAVQEEKGKKAKGPQEKERLQVFTGTVIARKGKGLSETFSVHRVAYGEGMERVFLLHSPKIASIEVAKRGRVRRSKLYYLRGSSGKKAKIQEFLGPTSKPTVEFIEAAASS